jgi:hypothetical protein
MELLLVFFKLLMVFAVADFALQSTDMVKGKNRNNRPTPPPGQKFIACWPYWLTSHALIHAAGVYIATGFYLLAALEFACHWLIDFLKCENLTNPHGDQALHWICRVAWAILAVHVL